VKNRCLAVKLCYMIDVRRMQILRAVVASGSVTGAASSLGYTPSAISQQVAALEKQTKTVLLERVGRGVRPTAAGRLLTDHAEVISGQLAEAEAALADLRAGRTGSLSVRYFSTAGAGLLPAALAQFCRDHPGVRVDLRLAGSGDPLAELSQGQADLAITIRAGQHSPSDIRLIHILDDPYLAVLPKGHRLAPKRTVRLADLAGEPWVATESAAGPCLRIVLDATAAAGFTPAFVAESDDYTSAQGFVAAGLGIAVIPRLGLASRHPGTIVRPITAPQPTRSVCAAVREPAAGQPALSALLTALQQTARAAENGSRHGAFST
jgi:DNA-binding transcriptional LysR family regulator